jgi:predicted DNA-binding transcriptional regulator YafY
MSAVITMLKGMAGTVEGSEHNILIEKLKNTLPPPQLKMLDSKVNRMVIDLSPWGGDGPVREMVTAIRRAIDEHKEIEFTYINQQGAKTWRRVEPYSVVLKAQKWYLYAWCSMRREFRLFKLSRVKELTVTDCFYNPRDTSMEKLPWDADWQKPQNMVELELVFIKEMEGIIEEWFQDEISYLEDGRMLVKTKLPENNWLYGFLLSYGTTLEVVSPPHIRSILRDTAAEIYKKYK